MVHPWNDLIEKKPDTSGGGAPCWDSQIRFTMLMCECALMWTIIPLFFVHSLITE